MRRRLAAKGTRIQTTTGAALLLLAGFFMALTLSTVAQAQGPGLTTIRDTVYRADGTAASGVVLISWPSFQTAEGDAVAAGNQSVTLGSGGAFVTQLVPNAGASPIGTFYVAVFQLDDGTVRTEYWAVPTTSPTTISAVRTTPGTGLGNMAATQQYVNAAVANRAVDATVVHLAGAETISGVKQFAAAPSLPSPVGNSDAANKGYVDTAVENVGAGSYVSKAGDTMTGPLTLPGLPTAPNQAANRQYVDSGLSAKADLVTGVVPTAELGSGVASSATCLTGNSTWGSCGGGAPAGITYATTALSWSQTIANALTGGTQATITLTPCPVGIDTTSGAGYEVFLLGGGNSEAVNVLTAPGACTSGAPSGTITFRPFYSYPSGSSIGSASSGIQETINAACGTDPTTWKNALCNVTIPANGPGYPNHLLNTYNVAGTIYLHSNESVLSGYGASLNCTGRGACLQIGDLTRSNDFSNNTVLGISFRTPTSQSGDPAFAGVAITQTQRISQVATITTATAHGFRPGDMVTIMFTDNSAFWGDAVITAVPNPTTFQYGHSGADMASQTTPGVVALTYVAILDNAMNTHLTDISYDKLGNGGAFNNFFDLWDDENATIDHFNNNAIPLNSNGNWTGSFVFSAGNQGALNQIAPVISLRDSTVTANYSNGLTVYNSNGIYIENTVLQATGPWQVYSANSTGNYQGAYLKNIYSESGPQMNPLSPAHSPFAGTGVAGLIAGPSSGAAMFSIAGSGGTQGWFATGGSGSTAYSYFVVAKDGTSGTQTSPMQVLNYNSTGSDSITVRWPRVTNGTDVISYDVLRAASPNGVGATYPYAGGCGGGSTTACGSVATNVAQCSGLVCTYTDSGSAATGSYTILQGSYTGNLIFWPGSIVTVNRSVSVDVEAGNPVGVGLSGNPVQVAGLCTLWGATSPGGYTACSASMTSANNGVPNQTATMMTDGAAAGGGMTVTKGRLNFSTAPSAALQPHHIITLVDSQPGLTRSTWGYRPAASANDTWIGTDVPSAGVGVNVGQLAFGSPISITNYIAATGDGVHANWLERLSATTKEFNVPVKFDQSVTIAGLANGCLNVASGVIGSTGSPCGTGGGGGVTSVFGRTGAVTANTGDYIVSQVTGAAADASVVHNTGNETIAGAKTFTNTVTINSNLVLPQGNGYVPTAGGIGLDTTAGLPVVNLGGTTHQVAFTSSNISGQAGTALALANTPTQCSGSFATGIAANGNANCTTPNVIQLAEQQSPPPDPPNWGVFWFDATTHTAHIEDNGQTMQLGLANLFNSDPGGDAADTVEVKNGSNPQTVRVYKTTDSGGTNYERLAMGYDGNRYYVGDQSLGTGTSHGIGFKINSSTEWFISAGGAFKPGIANSLDIGGNASEVQDYYFRGGLLYGLVNEGTTGTIQYAPAKYATASNNAVAIRALPNDAGIIGITKSASANIGNAEIVQLGYVQCTFENATTVGDYVGNATGVTPGCRDLGPTKPTGVEVIGRAMQTGGAGNNYVFVAPVEQFGTGGGAVSSVFGRTGAVVAQSGDYSVSQVTGAAADASVVHLAGAETISGAKTFSSDVTMSGNLNVAGNINQTGTSPTQWSGKDWSGTNVTVPSGMDYSLGVGSDGILHCQLAGGASCMGSGGVTSFNTRTGAVVAQSGDYTVAQVTGAVANTTTVNGHALSGNVTVSASDITTGTLPHAQLPALASGDIPNNAANTTGSAGSLSAASALPSGTTATTQAVGDNSNNLATTKYVDQAKGAPFVSVPRCSNGNSTLPTSSNKALVFGILLTYPVNTSKLAYFVNSADNTGNTYDVAVYAGVAGSSNNRLLHIGSTAGTLFSPSTGYKSINWAEGATTLQPGRYYLMLTSSATASQAAISVDSSFGTFFNSGTSGVSITTGGTSPTTWTSSADAWVPASSNFPCVWFQ